MAIYLFEISRITKSGKHLYRKDQFQYQVLHFFNNLRSCKTEDTVQAPPVSAFSQLQKQARRRNMRPGRIDRIEEESGNESDEDPSKTQLAKPDTQLSDASDSDEDLDELISGMKISCEGHDRAKCKQCTTRVKPSKPFVSLYKHLVNEILKF